jgi:hypothetical protein
MLAGKAVAFDLTAEYNEFRHLVQRYAATECNVIPPLS